MAGYINGRYGPFQPRRDQAAFYKRRQQAEAMTRREAAAARAAWLDKHKTCATGCGQPVAFHDPVHLALKHSGCCSAQCESVLAKPPGGAA